MKVVIDRIEEDTAVVELDGEMLHIPRALVGEAREGDALMITPAGSNAELAPEKPHRIFELLRSRRRRRKG